MKVDNNLKDHSYGKYVTGLDLKITNQQNGVIGSTRQVYYNDN